MRSFASLSRILPALFSCLLLTSCFGGEDDNDRDKVLVERILDGDTVELSDGRKVRYLGVDTPELKDGDCYAKEAKQFNESLVLLKEVELELDDNPTDMYGRTLAYVWLKTGSGERMVNEELLLKGYARTLFIPPNNKYKSELQAAEAAAVASGAGLWSACE